MYADHRKLTDPKVIGPGIWTDFHIISSQARTTEEKEHVIWVIRATQKKFTCGICRRHMGEYLEKNPPEATLDGDPESLFRWVWSFHNTVNSFTGKGQVTYEDAKALFWSDDSIVCTADCGKKEPEKKQPTLRLTPVKY